MPAGVGLHCRVTCDAGNGFRPYKGKEDKYKCSEQGTLVKGQENTYHETEAEKQARLAAAASEAAATASSEAWRRQRSGWSSR